jgi:hypothetical protein
MFGTISGMMTLLGRVVAVAGVLATCILAGYCLKNLSDPAFRETLAWIAVTPGQWPVLLRHPIDNPWVGIAIVAGLAFDGLALRWLLVRRHAARRGFAIWRIA